MAAPLDTLLADRLDVSEERAQELRRKLVQDLREHAAEGEHRLSELGAFLKDDGRLSFRPTETLARIVNRRFEGLGPAVLSGTVEETVEGSWAVPGPEHSEADPAPAEQSEASSHTWDFLYTGLEEESEAADDMRENWRSALESVDEAANEDGEEAAADSDDHEVQEESSSDDAPDDTSAHGPSHFHAPAPVWADRPSSRRSSFSAGALFPIDPEQSTLEKSPRDDLASAAPSPEDAPPSVSEPSWEPVSDRADDSRVDPFRLIVGALVVAFLVALSWIALSQTGILSDGRGTGSATVVDDGGTVASSSDSDPGSDEAAQGTNTDPATEAPSTDAPGSAAQADIDPTAGGWTIVVASLGDRSDAEMYAEKYRELFAGFGVPVDVLRSTEEPTRHRVVIGQYESHEAILNALEEHRSRLPDGAWALPFR